MVIAIIVDEKVLLLRIIMTEILTEPMVFVEDKVIVIPQLKMKLYSLKI